MKKPKDYLIVALDTSSEYEALKTVEKLSGSVDFFKIGLELFCSAGPGIIEKVKNNSENSSKFFKLVIYLYLSAVILPAFVMCVECKTMLNIKKMSKTYYY